MDCSRFAEAVKAHAAGGDLTREARAHLESCERCRADLASRQQLIAGIETDLAGALRVEPSPDFLARVRTRVAAPAVAPWWMPGWRVAVGAASLAIVAGLLAFSLLSGPAAPSSATPQVARTRPAPLMTPVAQPERPTRSAAERPASPRVAPRPTPVAARRSAEPEVLVPPDQRIAIGQLMRMLRAGTLDEKILAEPKEPPATSPLSVPAIVVEDLAVPAITIRSAVERRP